MEVWPSLSVKKDTGSQMAACISTAIAIHLVNGPSFLITKHVRVSQYWNYIHFKINVYYAIFNIMSCFDLIISIWTDFAMFYFTFCHFSNVFHVFQIIHDIFSFLLWIFYSNWQLYNCSISWFQMNHWDTKPPF